MSATELMAGSRDGSFDVSKGRVERVFLVDAPPDAALSDPGLPVVNSVYPGSNPNDPFPLRLDSYSRTALGNGTHTICTAHYSNDRTGRLNPNPDKTRPGFQTAEVSYQDTQAEFPAIMTYPLKIPGQSGASGRVGETTIYKIDETRVIYEISVVIQGFTNAQSFAAIAAQNNKLHKISGRYYRFRAGDIRQTEKDAWETTYTWFEDNGTPVPNLATLGSGSIPAGVGYPPNGQAIQIGPAVDERLLFLPPRGQNALKLIDSNFSDSAEYIRSPYHVISFYMQTNMVPVWYQFLPNAVGSFGSGTNGEGWRSLPGNLAL